jgi:ribosome silencing factor RsfS/YbeB/iojap
VPFQKNSTSKNTGDGAASAATTKRNIKAGAAGTSKGGGRRAARSGDPGPTTVDRGRAAAARAASLKALVIHALDDMKALEIKVLDVRGLTDVADTMVIASGTSDRHVRSVAQKVVEKTKAAGFRPHGIEGQQDSDWVLIDLHEIIVHVMLPRVREFYGLEKLWDMSQPKRAASG